MFTQFAVLFGVNVAFTLVGDPFSPILVVSASGNTGVLAFFGMSAGTAVAVINYISEIFSPVESLGMEIQTIQSAFAGIKRINEFLELSEKNKYDGTKSRPAERVDSEEKEGKDKGEEQ